jgi:predicted ABC-type sugar transport system permease subunit
MQVVASLVGFAATIAATILLVERFEVLAIPLGFSAGMGVRVALLGLVLAWRLRMFRPEPLVDPSGAGRGVA